MKKYIYIIIVLVLIVAGLSFTNSKKESYIPLGGSVLPTGFSSTPPVDVISPTAPTSISCSISATAKTSSVDGVTRIAQITWAITGGTAGLVTTANWYGYVPQNTNSTASESFSVPIDGLTTFKLTTSDGKATSTCSTSVS